MRVSLVERVRWPLRVRDAVEAASAPPAHFLLSLFANLGLSTSQEVMATDGAVCCLSRVRNPEKGHAIDARAMVVRAVLEGEPEGRVLYLFTRHRAIGRMRSLCAAFDEQIKHLETAIADGDPVDLAVVDRVAAGFSANKNYEVHYRDEALAAIEQELLDADEAPMCYACVQFNWVLERSRWDALEQKYARLKKRIEKRDSALVQERMANEQTRINAEARRNAKAQKKAAKHAAFVAALEASARKDEEEARLANDIAEAKALDKEAKAFRKEAKARKRAAVEAQREHRARLKTDAAIQKAEKAKDKTDRAAEAAAAEKRKHLFITMPRFPHARCSAPSALDLGKQSMLFGAVMASLTHKKYDILSFLALCTPELNELEKSDLGIRSALAFSETSFRRAQTAIAPVIATAFKSVQQLCRHAVVAMTSTAAEGPDAQGCARLSMDATHPSKNAPFCVLSVLGPLDLVLFQETGSRASLGVSSSTVMECALVRSLVPKVAAIFKRCVLGTDCSLSVSAFLRTFEPVVSKDWDIRYDPFHLLGKLDGHVQSAFAAASAPLPQINEYWTHVRTALCAIADRCSDSQETSMEDRVDLFWTQWDEFVESEQSTCDVRGLAMFAARFLRGDRTVISLIDQAPTSINESFHSSMHRWIPKANRKRSLLHYTACVQIFTMEWNLYRLADAWARGRIHGEFLPEGLLSACLVGGLPTHRRVLRVVCTLVRELCCPAWYTRSQGFMDELVRHRSHGAQEMMAASDSSAGSDPSSDAE